MSGAKKVALGGILLLCLCLGGYLYQRLRFPRIEFEGLEVPGRVCLGEEFPLSIRIVPRETPPAGCALFIHFAKEGLSGRRFPQINADVSIPPPARRWLAGRPALLGPFRCAIPAENPPGRYRIAAGLFYQERSPRGGERYVRIPYGNRIFRGWGVGSVEAVARPPRGYAASDFGAAGYAVGYAGPLDKVFPGKGDFRGPLARDVRLAAARNEYESFQLVCIPGDRALQNVAVAAEDLRGASGVISRENLTVRRVGFVETRRPYYNVTRVGRWPDPLIPLDAALPPVPPGEVLPLWVTVHVPAGAQPGCYEGAVTVAPEGMPATRVPLKLTVWDFALPERPSLKTGFDFYEFIIRKYYPRRPGESEAQWRRRTGSLCERFYRDMLAHRVSPIHNVGNPVLLGVSGGIYRLEFGDFDEKVERYTREGQTDFGIAVEARVNPDRNEWTDAWYGFTGPDAVRGVFRAYGMHLQSRGWLERAYAYIIDESYEGAASLTRMIHEGHPGIRNLLTQTPAEGYPDVDIWCVRINNLDRETARRFRAAGKEIWMYVASPTRPYPTIILDGNSIDARILPWMCWREGCEGLLYWCVNYWELADPWKDPMTWPDQNGNGSLLYPGESGPVDSLRLEVLRDGIEDFEYLKTGEEIGATDRLREMIEKTVVSPWEYTDAAGLQAARDRLGEEISAARGGGRGPR